jgi:hypothetical protein
MSEEVQNEAVVAAPESGVTAVPDAVENTPEEQEPKTFTQEELDRIIAAEKAKVERKVRRELNEALQEQRQQSPAEPPQPGQYNSAEDYAEALAEYKVEQKLAEREVQQQRKQAESTYAEREEEARAKYDDFQDVVYSPDLRITNEMAEVIKVSEIGPELAYHLGTNPKEAERISRLSPLSQARELGKIEASLTATNPPVGKKASSAPEPIRPVGNRSNTPKYDVTDPRSVKTMSDAEWIAARNQQVASKYRA